MPKVTLEYDADDLQIIKDIAESRNESHISFIKGLIENYISDPIVIKMDILHKEIETILKIANDRINKNYISLQDNQKYDNWIMQYCRSTKDSACISYNLNLLYNQKVILERWLEEWNNKKKPSINEDEREKFKEILSYEILQKLKLK